MSDYNLLYMQKIQKCIDFINNYVLSSVLITNTYIMRRQTPFPLEEAKAYIVESVKVWEESNEPKEVDKIISLAADAYNRRVKKAVVVNPAKKMRDQQLNIKELKRIIKRNKEAGIETPSLEKILETTKNIYDNLVAKHAEPVAEPKKP
jgi:hypothetical protein